MKIKIKKLENCFALPEYKTDDGTTLDLYSTVDMAIPARTHVIVPTGITLEVPIGFECQIRPRSGFAAKGIVVANSPATIDCNYKNEIKVILANLGTLDYHEVERRNYAALLNAIRTKAQGWEKLLEDYPDLGIKDPPKDFVPKNQPFIMSPNSFCGPVFIIKRGDIIAHLVISPVVRMELELI